MDKYLVEISVGDEEREIEVTIPNNELQAVDDFLFQLDGWGIAISLKQITEK